MEVWRRYEEGMKVWIGGGGAGARFYIYLLIWDI